MSNEPIVNQNPAHTNGHPSPSRPDERHVEPLPYFRAPQSPAVYRSINSARAQLDRSGILVAKRRLVTEMHDALKHQELPRIPIEELRPENAVTAAADRFVATTQLAGAVDTLDTLSERMHEIDDLRRGRPSPDLTMLNAIAHDAAAKQFADLEPQLAEAVATSPLAARQWLTAAQRHLQELNCPQATEHGFVRLAKIVGHLRSLKQDPAALPPHKREVIEQRLIHVGHSAALAALREIAAGQTIALYRHHLTALRAKLEAWQAQADTCDHKLVAISEVLDQEKTRLQHRQARHSRTGLIILQGPSEERVRETLAKELACSPQELPASLFKAWLERLAQQAAIELGEHIAAQPGELLARIDPEKALVALHALVDERLPQVSVYASVRRVGAEQFANEFYAKAMPLVQLDRQSVELGLEYVDAAILIAPTPHGPEDGHTLAAIKNALPSDGSIELRIVDGNHSEFRLTRTLSAFPAAAQSINRALLWAYAKCREHHHFPHLIGLVADSPDGRASEAAVALVASLARKQGVTNVH